MPQLATMRVEAFVALLAFRWLNASLVRTQFDPDEFWQSLEVARRIALGPREGHLAWEWSHAAALRSPTHPLLFAGVVWLLDAIERVGVGVGAWAAATAPRVVVQGTLAAMADAAVVGLAGRLASSSLTSSLTSTSTQTSPASTSMSTSRTREEAARKWALLLTCSSWFNFYAGVRTYSNAAEAAVTAVAVAKFWPLTRNEFEANHAATRKALALAAFAVALRPTAVMNWALLGLWLVWGIVAGSADTSSALRSLSSLSAMVAQTAVVAILALLLVDSLFYQRLVFTPWNFFKVNLVHNVSVLYGTHPWYWYLVVAFPVMLGLALPGFVKALLGGATTSPTTKTFARLVLASLLVLSLPAHKEFRFAMPQLLLALACAGASSTSNGGPTPRHVALHVLVNAIPALYLSLIHQRAGVDASLYVGSLGNRVTAVDYLLPCHAAPLHSHIATRNVVATFVDCSPPLEGLEDLRRRGPHVPHDTARFVADPVAAVVERYADASLWGGSYPSHIVTSDHFLVAVSKALSKVELANAYHVCKVFPHASEEVGRDLLLLCSSSSPSLERSRPSPLHS